jgi:hypothetical protein
MISSRWRRTLGREEFSERAVSRAPANGWWLVQEICLIGHACEQQSGILRRPHGWLEWPAEYQRHGRTKAG